VALRSSLLTGVLSVALRLSLLPWVVSVALRSSLLPGVVSVALRSFLLLGVVSVVLRSSLLLGSLRLFLASHTNWPVLSERLRLIIVYICRRLGQVAEGTPLGSSRRQEPGEHLG
jgi:hypothetical protein